MSWIEGIDDEIERARRQLAASRVHMVLEVPPGYSIAADIEPTSRGGERIHLRIDGPDLQMPIEWKHEDID